MKRVLVIGDANSIFVKQYVENVLCKNDAEVVLIKEGNVNQGYLSEYKRLGVNLVSREVGFISKIPGVRSWLGSKILAKKIYKKYGNLDIVHVHGVNKFRGALGNNAKKHANKYIVSVWGAEILANGQKSNQKNQKFN